MAALVRYRTGIDPMTGGLLTGFAHVAQSLGLIWLTRPKTRIMLLDFGSNVRSFLSEDITPATVLELYDALITAAHRWEPEYRISGMQLVHLKATGSLGLRHDGTYYPEGRFGNYAIAEPTGALAPIAAREAIARATV